MIFAALTSSHRVRQALPVAFLLVIALASSARAWTEPIAWNSDALLYQARVLQLRGESERAALEHAFRGPLGAELRRADEQRPPAARRQTNDAWVQFEAAIVKRRVFVPALAAAVYPVFGERSLLAVSIAGYAALGLLLYALLRRRFASSTSVAVAAACLLLPPLRNWSLQPMTDSWGVALEAAALLGAVLVLDRGLRWLPAWIAAIAALSLTRDAAVVAILAACWLAVRCRTRRAAALAASGAVLVLPAPLLLGAPLRHVFDIATASFDSVYWPNLRATVATDVWSYTLAPQQRAPALVALALALTLLLPLRTRLLQSLQRVALTAGALYLAILAVAPIAFPGLPLYGHAEIPAGIVVVIGLALLAFPGRPDAYLSLHRAAAPACALYLAVYPNPTAFRLELAFLPVVAVGLARTIERWPRASAEVAADKATPSRVPDLLSASSG